MTDRAGKLEGKIAVVTGAGRGIGRAIALAYAREGACAKAGLWMLTRALALQLWQYNISVNELVPGPVMTGMVGGNYAQRDESVFKIESEWVKQPEDVTPLALFLATQRPGAHRPGVRPDAEGRLRGCVASKNLDLKS